MKQNSILEGIKFNLQDYLNQPSFPHQEEP